MNFISIIILIGLLVLLFFQIKNFVIAIKNRIKDKKSKEDKTNQNNLKGDKQWTVLN